MQKLSFWILLALTLSMPACLSTIMGTKDSRSDSYQITEPRAGWQRMDPGEADHAYRNSADQSILTISSVCSEARYKTLEELSADLLQQLPSHELLETPHAAYINGHPALITEARGVVDGKPLHVRIAVVRTPSCLFDFILAGLELDRSSRLAFEQSLMGFKESSAR